MSTTSGISLSVFVVSTVIRRKDVSKLGSETWLAVIDTGVSSVVFVVHFTAFSFFVSRVLKISDKAIEMFSSTIERMLRDILPVRGLMIRDVSPNECTISLLLFRRNPQGMYFSSRMS